MADHRPRLVVHPQRLANSPASLTEACDAAREEPSEPPQITETGTASEQPSRWAPKRRGHPQHQPATGPVHIRNVQCLRSLTTQRFLSHPKHPAPECGLGLTRRQTAMPATTPHP